MRVRLMLWSVALLAVTSATSVSIRAELPKLPFIMRAFAVNMTNVQLPRGNAGVIQIRITGTTPDAARERLITTMVDKGQDALLSALQKEPAKGRISVPGWTGPDPNNYRLGWDLQYVAHSALPDGGDRYVIVTDRHMSFWEVREQPRTYDYPFLMMEIHMPKEGKGEGRMFGATKVIFDKKKNQIELEQYSAGDIRLNEIEIVK